MQSWIIIVSNMFEPFDYDEYLYRCRHTREQPIELNMYGQMVGMLMLAYQRYPRYQPQEAYDKLIQEIQPRRETKEHQPKQRGCKNCGS